MNCGRRDARQVPERELSPGIEIVDQIPGSSFRAASRCCFKVDNA